jgi:asparagine synthase (glutamine-hydrolysing)
MCGFVGLRRFDGRKVEEAELRKMAATLGHRGPDGDGFRVFGDVGFGHTRLSIIDLAGSPQPMSSANGPCHITFNGEIFNYQAVRSELERYGVKLRTHGDTEVLLETLRSKDLAGLADLNGQFAFAYYDEDSGELLLARDRMGILPLYYHEGPDFFAFASEVKALIALIGTPGVDDEAVEDYLTYGSVPPPRTLFKGIRKLAQGTALRVGRDGKLRSEVYWALPVGDDSPLLDGEDAIREVDRQLCEAVALRLVADVPVGAYLSGGLDSSLIVALMKKLRDGGEVQTFAAGFADERFDELPYARQVSEAVGTTHHEVMVSATDFRELWQTLTWHCDGPVSQPADIAIYKIAKQARAEVKVLLSGEGSDEIFGGYPKYAFEPKLAPLAGLPAMLRVPAFRAVERFLPESKNRARQAARALSARSTGERMQTWFAPFTWYERQALRPGYGSFRNPGQWERAKGDGCSTSIATLGWQTPCSSAATACRWPPVSRTARRFSITSWSNLPSAYRPG